MKKLLTGIVIIAALLGATAAQAQATAESSAYTGPQFPDGPDSLRALVYRSTRLASSAPAGRVALKFELKDGREPRNFKLITPPAPVNSNLTKAAKTAMSYLQAQMPAWTPGTPDPEAKSEPSFTLALDFTTPLGAQPYPYADQNPVFPDLAALLRAQNNVYFERVLARPDFLKRLASPAKGLAAYVQMQVRYPAAALREQQQGVVYVYFEVAENGAIEHTQLLGTASEVLDDEVLRVATQIPAATTPALQRGRPVRTFYIMPISFRIQ